MKTLSTQAGDLPLIPEWTLSYTGDSGHGCAVLPAYIVSEDLIEYHWLDRSQSARLPAWSDRRRWLRSIVVVKFGAVVVKGASYAHYQVTVQR